MGAVDPSLDPLLFRFVLHSSLHWLPSFQLCRRSGPAVAELNGRVYAVGGHDGPTVKNSAEVYNPETDTWQRIADLNVRRRNAGTSREHVECV